MGAKNIYERFIWFDQRIRSRKYPNATKLARQFEISTKTAQRDIEFMRDRLRCPLHYDKTVKGYYYEDNTFSLPFIYLSSKELSSLLIARKFLKDISDGYIGEEVSTAIEKITTILKKHIPVEDIIDNALSFQFIEYSPVPQEVVKAVLEGCLKKRSLSFTYYSPLYDGKSMRTVDPYHLLNYMGTWYLIAYCHTRKDIRDFHLGRISDLKVLDNSFAIQTDFDIKEHLNSAFGIYKGKATKQVALRFSPLKVRWVSGQIWHKNQKSKLLKNGSLQLTFPVANYGEIMMEILKHGSGVEVIKPKSLRELIKTAAKKITKIY